MKKTPIKCTTTRDPEGTYEVVFNFSNGDRATIYQVEASMVDAYESGEAELEEFYYSIV